MSHHSSQLVAAYMALALVALIARPRSFAAAASQPASIDSNAGTWPTWLLSSGSELRPSAAPDETVTIAELPAVQALAAARDQGSLDRIRYWDAGAPTYRWIQRDLRGDIRAGEAIGRSVSEVVWLRSMDLINRDPDLW